MSGDQLEALVLGLTVIRSNGLVVAVDRHLERALSVRLALAGGAGVPDERLAADLWGDGQNERPAGRRRVVASRLRSAPASTGTRVKRTAAGYRLDAVAADLRAGYTVATRAGIVTRAAAFADAEFAASGFGWRHLVERLRAVQDGLSG